MKSLSVKSFLFFGLCLLLARAVVAADTADSSIPKIPYEKYTLPNGMDVILHEDHSTPIVGVNIWYHVGSKNEVPGRTGFAHLFEHMMFQGSKHFDNDYFLPLQKAGGQVNGSTSNDRTNYWETVPSNYLELALWLESDRMAFLLPSMTQERLDNQRSVVKNERRQSYENQPYGLVMETILAAMLPPDHPYSWDTIGSMADIDAASREDISDFFRRYYHPGNASLCIAGDFDPAVAKKLVEKYFGSIPAGPKVERPKPRDVELKESKRIKMTDRVGLARLYKNWLTVPAFASDDAELDILANILAGDKTSRLYRLLVREKQVAQDVSAYQYSQEIGGMFGIMATARPGKELAEIESLIQAELKKIQDEPPTQTEIDRAIAGFETGVVSSLEGISGFGGRADQLNKYNTMTGDPGYLAKDFARYRKVKPADVQRAAKKYLAANTVTVEVTPGKETKIEPDPRKPDADARDQLAKTIEKQPPVETPLAPETADRENLPKQNPEPKFKVPTIQRAKLSNGMKLMVVENHELPAVSVHLTFPFGKADDPADKLGLAGLTASVWDEGTEKRTSEKISEDLADIGASLSVSTDQDNTSAGLYTLKRNLGKALDIFSDVVINPSFPEAEINRQRNLAFGQLTQIRNQPAALAGLAFNQTIYGYEHPYGKPSTGTPESLKSITQTDLKKFHKTVACPEQATAIVVGDITLDEAKAELEKVFGQWKSAGKAADGQFTPPTPKETEIILVDKPGAVQSVIAVGLIGNVRKTPDFFPMMVMNMVFGGQFSSRLNMNLREEKGYTYGANSRFNWRARDLGTFIVSTSVQTDVTAPALAEILKDIEGICGAKPVEADELDFNKKYMTRAFPGDFETSSLIAGRLETLAQFQLPDNYFETVLPGINAVSSDNVTAMAKKYLKVGNLSVIIVGDRSKIEAPLRELPIGKNLKVVQFDDAFRLEPAKSPDAGQEEKAEEK
jgi:zinc protease